jgi:hypothetical protein
VKRCRNEHQLGTLSCLVHSAPTESAARKKYSPGEPHTPRSTLGHCVPLPASFTDHPAYGGLESHTTLPLQIDSTSRPESTNSGLRPWRVPVTSESDGNPVAYAHALPTDVHLSAPQSFSQLAALNHLQEKRSCFHPTPAPFKAVCQSTPTNPVAPATLAVSSEPSSLMHLSPSALRTPRASCDKMLPLSYAAPNARTSESDDEFHTPKRAITSSSLSDGCDLPCQLWAPCRNSPTCSKFEAIRRFSHSSSDNGSPVTADSTASPHWRGYARPSQHRGYHSSEDGTDSYAGRLVCNLVERFNNAQLYDDINRSP